MNDARQVRLSLAPPTRIVSGVFHAPARGFAICAEPILSNLHFQRPKPAAQQAGH
jgi:hypothetical protein